VYLCVCVYVRVYFRVWECVLTAVHNLMKTRVHLLGTSLCAYLPWHIKNKTGVTFSYGNVREDGNIRGLPNDRQQAEDRRKGRGSQAVRQS